MDHITNKSYNSYDYISRYSVVPTYYHKIDDKRSEEHNKQKNHPLRYIYYCPNCEFQPGLIDKKIKYCYNKLLMKKSDKTVCGGIYGRFII